SCDTTSTASATAATARMKAECRSRSDHGEKIEEDDGGASMAISAASPVRSQTSSVSTLVRCPSLHALSHRQLRAPDRLPAQAPPGAGASTGRRGYPPDTSARLQI